MRDPRLQLSLIVLSIHVLGQFWLGFGVSIAQIAVTVLTGAVIEVVWIYRRTRILAWPASGLSSSVGIALVFRVVGTENGDYWSFRGWYLFVAVAAFSLLTKYLVRFRGSHIFNPSNVALVVAFLLLGSGRVEPLDFWWAPLGWIMALAYMVMLFGGLFLSVRLRLLGMAVSFWAVLAAGTAVISVQGHCITTQWSFIPVCGQHFWWIIITSPEVIIFMFFMITDPRTVPAGRVARAAHGVVLGVVCTVLIAPWDTEFGAKVGLLAGLVLVCAARPLFDRVFPPVDSAEDRIGSYLGRLMTGARSARTFARMVARGVVVIVVIGGLGIGVAFAGLPNSRSDGAVVVDASVLEDLAAIEATSLPVVSVGPNVAALSATLASPEGAQQLAETLVWNLGVEFEALARGTPELLPAVDHGERLTEMETAVAAGDDVGERVLSRYEFDSLHLMVVFAAGSQGGANAGLVAQGTVTEITVATTGEELRRQDRPFALTFALLQMTSGRWLTTSTFTPTESDLALP